MRTKEGLTKLLHLNTHRPGVNVLGCVEGGRGFEIIILKTCINMKHIIVYWFSILDGRYLNDEPLHPMSAEMKGI